VEGEGRVALLIPLKAPSKGLEFRGFLLPVALYSLEKYMYLGFGNPFDTFLLQEVGGVVGKRIPRESLLRTGRCKLF
jgi:hypothetical protein